VLKSGGEKALTKHVHDEALKYPLTVEDAKVEVVPKMIDNSMIISSTHIVRKPRNKVKVRVVKPKVTIKKSRLYRAIQHLFDLEEAHEPEKPLNVDFGLYQMENY
jgi:hypothetical protein